MVEAFLAALAASDVDRAAALVDDDVLDHYIVSARWGELGTALVQRYQGLAPNLRVMSYSAIGQWRRDPEVFARWAEVAATMRAADRDD